MDFEHFMHLSLEQAMLAGDEVPVGAVLVDGNGNVLAAAHNYREQKSDPTSHAEIEVIRDAANALGSWRLENTTLFVTLEPCVMCAGAIVAARIPRVVFGAWDEKVGAAGSAYDILRDARLGKPIEVIPEVLGDQCQKILKDFFEAKR
ncbi:MAG: nucleoside deaminase [Aquiluna sp.]|nr:nucleoside deaminase [Micrococcales bacterium]MBT7925418.1 nucleoside deaminase [Micrococcales bacterium]MDG1818053.1 nucleoside deaminase [Aquiluna sp.]